MKTTFITMALMLGLTLSGISNRLALSPSPSPLLLSSLATDADFVSSVNAILELELKVMETGSSELLNRSVANCLSTREKRELANRLGYPDYESLSGHFDNIGAAVKRLKDKCPSLNNSMLAPGIIKTSLDEMAIQGKVTMANSSAYNMNVACLRALYEDIVACFRTSSTTTTSNLCIRAALAEFRACLVAQG
jgi:hypothetical protein